MKTFHWLATTFSNQPYQVVPATATPDAQVRAYAIQLKDSRETYLAVWQDGVPSDKGAIPAQPARDVTISLGLPDGTYSVQTLDPAGNKTSAFDATASHALELKNHLARNFLHFRIRHLSGENFRSEALTERPSDADAYVQGHHRKPLQDLSRRKRPGCHRRGETSTSRSRARNSWSLSGRPAAEKSTTLRMIAGLEEISKGSIYIDDRKVKRCPAEGPRHRDGLPKLCALSAHDGLQEHGVRPAIAELPERRNREAGARLPPRFSA